MLIQTFLFVNNVPSLLLCTKLENGQRNSNIFFVSGTIQALCPQPKSLEIFQG
jgi:hypothetical protein